MGTLCRKHRAVVVSDEIHCDLTDPDCGYVPFASVSEKTASPASPPTKAFDLAGLQTAAVSVPDPFSGTRYGGG